MLNFQPKKPPKPGTFTLDPVQRERAKAPVSRGRQFHLVVLAGVIGITGYLFWAFMDDLRNALSPVTTRLNQEVPLTPMAKPTIATLPPLPDAAAINAHLPGVAEQLANGTVPLWIEQPDASTMAWVGAILAKDLATPPLPQRVEARDLILRHLRVGENIVISGLLEDSQPAPIAGAGTGYQHLLIALPEQQYLQVLAPESARDLLIGDEIVVVGRFIGFATLPVAEVPADPPTAPATPAAGNAAPGGQEAPVASSGATAATVEAAAPIATSVQVPLIAARLANKPAVQREVANPYVMRGEWRLPADVYENIDDNLLVVETRPYYFTLGQVLLDRTTPETFQEIPSANEQGTAIHRDPSKFRGQPFTIRGHVFHAWEDTGVAHDQPFGVTRVVRIIMWSEDWGDWDVTIDGQVVTKRKLVLRAFELAAITHQPLPLPGQVITATGRFLRMRSMEVPSNAQRDSRLGIKRQSERAHTFLFVTNEFATMPPLGEYDFSPIWFILLAAAILMCAALMRTARRESKKKDQVLESVRKMRDARQALKGKRIAASGTPPPSTGPAAVESSEPTDPPAPKPG